MDLQWLCLEAGPHNVLQKNRLHYGTKKCGRGWMVKEEEKQESKDKRGSIERVKMGYLCERGDKTLPQGGGVLCCSSWLGDILWCAQQMGDAMIWWWLVDVVVSNIKCKANTMGVLGWEGQKRKILLQRGLMWRSGVGTSHYHDGSLACVGGKFLGWMWSTASVNTEMLWRRRR